MLILRGLAFVEGQVLLNTQVAQPLPQGSLKVHLAWRYALTVRLLLPFSLEIGQQRHTLKLQRSPKENKPSRRLQHPKRTHFPTIRFVLLQRSLLLLLKPILLSPQAVRKIKEPKDNKQIAVVFGIIKP